MSACRTFKLSIISGCMLIISNAAITFKVKANDYNLKFSDFSCPTQAVGAMGCWTSNQCIIHGGNLGKLQEALDKMKAFGLLKKDTPRPKLKALPKTSTREVLELAKDGRMRFHVWTYTSADCSGQSSFLRSQGEGKTSARDGIYVALEREVTKGNQRMIYTMLLHSGQMKWETRPNAQKQPKSPGTSSLYHLSGGKLCFYPSHFSSNGKFILHGDGFNDAIADFNLNSGRYGAETYFFSGQHIKDMTACINRIP